jgi:hypothetical protein
MYSQVVEHIISMHSSCVWSPAPSSHPTNSSTVVFSRVLVLRRMRVKLRGLIHPLYLKIQIDFHLHIALFLAFSIKWNLIVFPYLHI